jgi:hypothetical protein
MADAYVIETAGETAGIVVRDRRGVRFYAAEATFYPIDGKSFDHLRAVHRAVAGLIEARRIKSSPGPLRRAA